jgi:uncharacterized protein YjiS (DUF1127 family)
MAMRFQTARAERNHTRPSKGDAVRAMELGAIFELNGSSRRFAASAIDAEIPPPLLGTESLLLRLADLLLTWLRRSQQRRQLGSLSDSMLKDIGVSRANVDYETSRRFWRD